MKKLLILLCLIGCSAQIAAERVEKELPNCEEFVRIAEEPDTTREDYIQIVYKYRYTMHVLNYVLNDIEIPANLEPPGGWAIGNWEGVEEENGH